MSIAPEFIPQPVAGKVQASCVDISEDWRFSLDPDNQGREWDWAACPPDSATLLSAGYPLEFWYPGYDGVAWYWKELASGESAEGRMRKVRFAAVSYWCEAWLNGHHLGTHEGAYDGFAFDLTPFWKQGESNLLCVRVINPPVDCSIEGWRSGAPLNQSDLPIGKTAWYYNYGGLWGRVVLETLPLVHLLDCWVDADWDTRRLRVRWTAWNGGELDECEMKATVRERATGRVISEATQRVVVQRERSAGEWNLSATGLADWSIELPILYRLELALSATGGEHLVSRQFGLREFRWEAGRFFLNGKPVCLKGVLQQGSYPRRLAAPETWRMGARELLTLKKAGFNFLRAHLKPTEAWYLDLADRLGLLVMLEPPLGWIAHGPQTEARIHREVRVLIEAHRSRASVVMWGLFNESFHLLGFEPAEIRELAGRVTLAAREYDDSRLLIDTSGGYAHVAMQGAETMIHDTFRNAASRGIPPRGTELAEIMDVHAYCDMPPSPEIVDQYRRLDPGALPLFLSEYGAAETPPEFSRVLARYSERDRQVGLEDWRLHEDFYRSLQERFAQAALAGDFTNVAGWIQALNEERAREISAITLSIRRNPFMAGYCYCQLADASGELFGLLDFWRRPKPLLKAITEAMADPAVGILVEKRWLAVGEGGSMTVSVVTDAAEPLSGQFEVEIVNAAGEVAPLLDGTFSCQAGEPWERRVSFGPLPPGLHTVQARVRTASGATSHNSGRVGVLPESSLLGCRISARLVETSLLAHLAALGAEVESFGNNYRDKEAVILLDWMAIASSPNAHCELLGQIRNITQAGGVAVILNPDTPMLYQWLLPSFIGVQPVMRTGAYLRQSSIFAGLPTGVAGEMQASVMGHRWDNGDHVAAAGGMVEVGAFSMHMWTKPAKYFWGAGLYRIPHGRGQIFISHLQLLDRWDSDPFARQVFCQLLASAKSFIQPGGADLLQRRCIDRIDVGVLSPPLALSRNSHD